MLQVWFEIRIAGPVSGNGAGLGPEPMVQAAVGRVQDPEQFQEAVELGFRVVRGPEGQRDREQEGGEAEEGPGTHRSRDPGKRYESGRSDHPRVNAMARPDARLRIRSGGPATSGRDHESPRHDPRGRRSKVRGRARADQHLVAIHSHLGPGGGDRLAHRLEVQRREQLRGGLAESRVGVGQGLERRAGGVHIRAGLFGVVGDPEGVHQLVRDVVADGGGELVPRLGPAELVDEGEAIVADVGDPDGVGRWRCTRPPRPRSGCGRSPESSGWWSGLTLPGPLRA